MAVLDYNATFINDCGVALLNNLAGAAGANGSSSGTFVSPVSVMLALALLLNGAAPGSATFWCAPYRAQLASYSACQQSLCLMQRRRIGPNTRSAGKPWVEGRVGNGVSDDLPPWQAATWRDEPETAVRSEPVRGTGAGAHP